ncbi:MAG TPA: rhomboid family intramembrane serine protease [Candidatus Angelobacter sp.]|nr:rhomboid family intramembrane serine protease [Candidatus Angelobacter sp.]
MILLPIRDDAPRSTPPLVNYFLILLNIAVFLLERFWGIQRAVDLHFGFVPRHVNLWLNGRLPLEAVLIPLFSSMFLHVTVWHLISNMWFLAIFGDNVEDRLGHFQYLIFYLITGLAANITHYFFNFNSNIPSVGASGAIAGIMGAYFTLFPTARVLTLAVIFFPIWLPAWLLLGYWFVLELLNGTATALLSTRQPAGGVAFWAHIGGFVAGVVLIKIMPARTRYFAYDYGSP